MGLLGSGSKLAMDLASRMQRARDMGFDVDTRLFHGTNNPNIMAFKTSPHDETGIQGISVSDDPILANEYADPRTSAYRNKPAGSPNVLPLMVRGEIPDYMDFVDEVRAARGIDEGELVPDEVLLEYARQNGVTGVDMYGSLGHPEISMFDPSAIRSINAAFDPAKKDSPDLLASVPYVGAAGLLGAGVAPEEAEAGPLSAGMRRIIDPRFSNSVNLGTKSGAPRKGVQSRMEVMPADVRPRSMDYGSDVNLADFEGSPYILTQSDRSAAGGLLTGVHGIDIDPVDLRGGRDFMFDQPSEGMVWASDPNVVGKLKSSAEMLKSQTGKDPLLLPYAMTPTGMDFATMPLDTMVNYARARMSKKNKAKLNTQIKKVIPDWPGIDDPRGNAMFRDIPGDKRKAVANIIDKDFRDIPGGMSMGEARSATAASDQYRSPEGEIVNVGRIDTSRPVIADSGHPTYIGGLPGEGVGRLTAPLSALDFMRANGREPTNWTQDARALSMNPAIGRGVIDEPLLRKMYGGASPGLLGALAAGAAGAAQAINNSDVGQALGNAAGTLLQAPEAVLRGWRGLLSLPQGIDAAANEVRTDQDAANYEMGGLLADKGYPKLGYGAYLLPQIISPF